MNEINFIKQYIGLDGNPLSKAVNNQLIADIESCLKNHDVLLDLLSSLRAQLTSNESNIVSWVDEMLLFVNHSKSLIYSTEYMVFASAWMDHSQKLEERFHLFMKQLKKMARKELSSGR